MSFIHLTKQNAGVTVRLTIKTTFNIDILKSV